MRPGLLCPGRAPGRARHDGDAHASMRPGLLCPGSSATGSVSRPAPLLQ